MGMYLAAFGLEALATHALEIAGAPKNNIEVEDGTFRATIAGRWFLSFTWRQRRHGEEHGGESEPSSDSEDDGSVEAAEGRH
jgi:hypothetical protein